MTEPTLSTWYVGGPVRREILGMELECWQTMGGDCIAEIATGDDWATLYGIRSGTEGRGQATALLNAARRHYLLEGKRFGSSVAINPRMRAILRRLNIREYR